MDGDGPGGRRRRPARLPARPCCRARPALLVIPWPCLRVPQLSGSPCNTRADALRTVRVPAEPSLAQRGFALAFGHPPTHPPTPAATARDTIRADVYAYWVARRKALGRPLMRRLIAPTPINDQNPYNVFRWGPDRTAAAGGGGGGGPGRGGCGAGVVVVGVWGGWGVGGGSSILRGSTELTAPHLPPFPAGHASASTARRRGGGARTTRVRGVVGSAARATGGALLLGCAK